MTRFLLITVNAKRVVHPFKGSTTRISDWAASGYFSAAISWFAINLGAFDLGISV